MHSDEELAEKNRKELYKEYYDPDQFFSQESRCFCFDIAKGLLFVAKRESSDNWYISTKCVRAILLTQFCWNYASPLNKNLNSRVVRELLSEQMINLKIFEDRTIMDIDRIDTERIARIYANFKDVFGQTGASQSLGLLNPSLFMMWDKRIREFLRNKIIDGIDDGRKPEHYLNYLRGMKDIIKDYSIMDKIEDDEYLSLKQYKYLYVHANNLVENEES